MMENILYGFLANALWWFVIVGSGVYLLNKRRLFKRDFSQVVGTYLSFHKRVGREIDNITVNVLDIQKKMFWRGISVKYLNGAKFKDGKISALYIYKGTITKGDPEYALQLHCEQLNEDLYGIVSASNCSFQLCPWMHISRSYKILPYANIGIIIGQQYFIRNFQKKNMKALVESALDFVSQSNSPFFIEIAKTQHDSLEFFHQKFNIAFIENIESGPSLIQKDKYDLKKIKNFGPYI